MATQILLVSAPADAPMAVPGTIYDRFCMMCGKRMMLAPSGQCFLKQNPGAVILCLPCFVRGYPTGTGVLLPGAIEEAAAAVTNMWRYRN